MTLDCLSLTVLKVFLISCIFAFTAYPETANMKGILCSLSSNKAKVAPLVQLQAVPHFFLLLFLPFRQQSCQKSSQTTVHPSSPPHDTGGTTTSAEGTKAVSCQHPRACRAEVHMPRKPPPPHSSRILTSAWPSQQPSCSPLLTNPKQTNNYKPSCPYFHSFHLSNAVTPTQIFNI